MLVNTREYFLIEKSIMKLNNLDKHYYPKEEKFNKYPYKSELIDDIRYNLVVSVSKQEQQLIYRELDYNKYREFLLNRVGVIGIVESLRLRNSFRQKTIRLRSRINRILDRDNLFFITFTFDNKKLRKDINSIKQESLRKYVTRWLKCYCNDYVGNVDFGGKNGRIHFHAVVSLKESKVNNKTWRYGALNFERIFIKDDKSLSLYVNKLCSHALKESTKRQTLLYPKKNS